MKKSTFRRQVVLVVWMLLCGLSAQAADEDLITEQITINALEAGTLPQRISSSKKNLITNLKIIGEINGTDLKFIHEMAGQDINGFSTDGKLSILDLYDAKIVSGGESYNKFDNHTEDNRIGDYTFYGCSELTSVTLPPSVTSIGHFAFCDYMCIIKYFLDIISPNNDMLDKMHNLFSKFPEIDLAALGFPVGWEQEPLWIQANN